MDSRILHYEFVTGESVNITVSAEIAEIIYDSRRMEHASNERSRYHTAFSLDSEDYEGTNLVSEKTPDDLMEELEDRKHLLDCLAHLSENQRQRILMLAQGMSITEIARVQHADRTTVRESIQRLPPINRSTAAYAPPEVVDGKPPLYPYTPIKSSFEDAGSVEDMMLYTELEAAVKVVKGTVSIGSPKSKDSIRDIPVPLNVRPCAIKLRDTTDQFIWESPKTGLPCNPTHFRDVFRKSLEEAGDVRLLTPHSCRHTYVSQMQALGVDIQTIQSIVGHADTEMTEHYLHVQESIRQSAIQLFSEAFSA